MAEEDSLIQFPCDFPIKVMGIAEDDFDLIIVEIVRRHAPDLGEGAVRSRHSKEGKYISVTVTVNAQSREQLDNIYLDLTEHEKVIMAL
ncbi:MAG: DUF493 domain-containing protein [Pseudomonadota bacterium]